jgi:hypothetical protein
VPPRSSTVSGERPPQTTYRIEVEDDGQERYDYNGSPLEYRGDYLFDGADQSHEAILAPTDTTTESALKSVGLIGQLLIDAFTVEEKSGQNPQGSPKTGHTGSPSIRPYGRHGLSSKPGLWKSRQLDCLGNCSAIPTRPQHQQQHHLIDKPVERKTRPWTFQNGTNSLNDLFVRG